MSPAAAGDALLTPLSGASPAPSVPGRPIGRLGFLGVVITSFGGPLALAALYAPTIVDDTASSAGLVSLLAAAAFAVPLIVWLRYAGHVAGRPDRRQRSPPHRAGLRTRPPTVTGR